MRNSPLTFYYIHSLLVLFKPSIFLFPYFYIVNFVDVNTDVNVNADPSVLFRLISVGENDLVIYNVIVAY